MNGKITAFYLTPLFDPEDLSGAILAARKREMEQIEEEAKAKRERSAEICFGDYDEIPIERLEAFITKAKERGCSRVSVSVQWGYYHEIDGITLIADPHNKE